MANTVRSLVLSFALLALAPLAVFAQTAAFNLPSQPLAESLKALGALTNVNVMVSPTLVDGKTAPALTGDVSTQDALARLLKGTGLEYVFINDQTVVIREKGAASATNKTPPARQGSDVHRTAWTAADNDERVSDGPAENKAQQTPSGEPVKLEEIVVTAQKRRERLIDTPQSVSVLTADALAKLGATQFRDFANTVPGLSFNTTGAGFTEISLRGVTAGRDIGPTVGIYVDEVPYGSSTTFGAANLATLDVGLFDLDRIEVLRGPQGTLYGASTMGGLIKYVTRQPNTTRFGVDLQSGISSTSEGGVSYNGSAAINLPVAADKAGLRVSGFYSHDGGYVDNIALGQKDVNRSNVYGGRADLLLTPTDALSVRITGFLQNISRNGEGTADYSFSGTPIGGSLDQRRLVPEPYEQHFRLASATLAYDLGEAALTAISGYQTAQTDVSYDFSALFAGFGLPYGAVGYENHLQTDKFTQEVRLASKEANTIQWTLGGFYTHENTTNQAAYAPRDLAGQPAPNILFALVNPSRYQEYALFGDLTWRLTDKLDVTPGARYSRNEQRFEQIASGLFGVSTPPRDSDEDVFTYLANARYHFNERVMGYLRYATGYRPGGPNYVGRNPVTGAPLGPETFDADRLKSYEAGLKSETADRRFALDLAGYYIDWSDIQVSAIRSGFLVIANAGGAGILGAELSLTARPSDDFTVATALAYQDAHLTEDAPDVGGRDGERLPNVPHFTASLNGDYRLSHSDFAPLIGTTLRYVGERTANFDNSVGFLQSRLPDYTVVDLRAGFKLGSVDAQIYVHNAFDKRGELSAFNRGGPAVAMPAILQPRTFGVTLSTRF